MARTVPESEATTIIELVDMDTVRQGRASFVGLGLAFTVLGVLAILLPYIASLVTAVVIGLLMLLGGVLQGYHAIKNRRWAGSGWALASAAIQVLAGVLVVAFPTTGTLALTLILAAYFAAEGVFKIIRAVQHRRMPAWGWLLFDGVLSLALGVMIIVFLPGAALWALGVLVGIHLLFGGTSMLLIGLGARPVIPARP